MIKLTALKNFSRVKKYPRGTILAREGLCTDLYIVLKGEVGVFANHRHHNEEHLSTLGPGDFFGETAFLLEKSPPYAAVALSDVIALPVNRLNAHAFLCEEPEMALEVMRALCAKMDELQSAYEQLAGHPWSPTQPAPQAAAPVPAEAPQQAAPASAPTAMPAAPEPVALPGDLFPEGHGSYALPMDRQDPAYLMDKHYACPYCKHKFTAQQVRASRLVMGSTDPDMRQRYQGIEPLYYDVVTCPNCLYSALNDQFSSPENFRADLRAVQALGPKVKPLFAGPRGTGAVFAGFYLGLLCAPQCFTRHRLATAKLALKLSRVYQDCNDAPMERESAARALDAYLYLYSNEENDAGQDQQLCLILGELYLKQNNLKSARDFFFKAKMNREGSPLLRNQADERLSQIREAVRA